MHGCWTRKRSASVYHVPSKTLRLLAKSASRTSKPGSQAVEITSHTSCGGEIIATSSSSWSHRIDREPCLDTADEGRGRVRALRRATYRLRPWNDHSSRCTDMLLLRPRESFRSADRASIAWLPDDGSLVPHSFEPHKVLHWDSIVSDAT